MATNILLMSLTDHGIKRINEAPARVQEAIKGFEAMGGHLIAFYPTLGQYDYVAIGEGLDDAATMTFLLSLGAKGYVRTTTLRAMSPEDFAKCCSMVPPAE